MYFCVPRGKSVDKGYRKWALIYGQSLGVSNVCKITILKHLIIQTIVLGSAGLVSAESFLEMQKWMPYSRFTIPELQLNKIPNFEK